MFFHLIRKASIVLPLLTLFAAGKSSAQTNTATNTSTSYTAARKLTSADFSLYLERYTNGNWIQMNDTEVKYFFNRGRCECGNSELDTDENHKFAQFFKVAIVPAANTTTTISTILQSNATGYQGDCRLYGAAAGTGCLDVNSTSSVILPSVCTNLRDPDTYASGFTLASFSAMTGTRIESDRIPASTLFGSILNPGCGATHTCNAPSNCAIAQGSATIFFWAQSVAGISPDMTDEILSVNIAGAAQQPPVLNDPLPPNSNPQGGNEALTVSWDWPSGVTPSQNTALLGLQVFCKRGADTPVFKQGSFSQSYRTARDLCPKANVDMSSYGEFHGLDPAYLCSGLLPPNTKSYRISGLQNGIYYGVGVAAVDRYGNISPITDVRYGKPIPTVDFYTEYREAGGNAEGGFCAIAGWRGRPGVLALAALAVVGLVVVRRRRKGPPGAATLVVLVAAGTLVTGQARADGLFFDDMATSRGDDEEQRIPPAPAEPPPPKPPSTWTGSDRDFALEIRFGLYTPNVDSEFKGDAARPNALLFGDMRRPMWQVEFDWEILQVFGTLAVGASVGYWKENARACYREPIEASNWKTCIQKDRSGDNTSLRLIPFAALLVYRMDEAAIRWGIPIVPYGKIGLNYTIWTVNNGDGRVPESPKGGRGQGGTPGWQAAVGLALQLDFIDPAAAREFDSESGINHTYAFFEVDHVDGSGLYRSDVLHVGDNTWFAGLMFEF
jgi:hypothetical protein